MKTVGLTFPKDAKNGKKDNNAKEGKKEPEKKS